MRVMIKNQRLRPKENIIIIIIQHNQPLNKKKKTGFLTTWETIILEGASIKYLI